MTIDPCSPDPHAERRGLVRHRVPVVLHRQAAFRRRRSPTSRSATTSQVTWRAYELSPTPRRPRRPEIDALAEHKGIPPQVSACSRRSRPWPPARGSRTTSTGPSRQHVRGAPAGAPARRRAGLERRARAGGPVLRALRARRRPGRRRDARADRRRGRARRGGGPGRLAGGGTRTTSAPTRTRRARSASPACRSSWSTAHRVSPARSRRTCSRSCSRRLAGRRTRWPPLATRRRGVRGRLLRDLSGCRTLAP